MCVYVCEFYIHMYVYELISHMCMLLAASGADMSVSMKTIQIREKAACLYQPRSLLGPISQENGGFGQYILHHPACVYVCACVLCAMVCTYVECVMKGYVHVMCAMGMRLHHMRRERYTTLSNSSTERERESTHTHVHIPQ